MGGAADIGKVGVGKGEQTGGGMDGERDLRGGGRPKQKGEDGEERGRSATFGKRLPTKIGNHRRMK